MKIASVLKEQNIAEYLIYMWQVEDLIRAHGCDLDQVEEKVIARYPESEQEALKEWYGNLITMMYEEGVRHEGHLQINRNVMQNLIELNNQLLASPQFPFYSAAYYKALPFIVELRSKNKQKNEPELATCFEALYGVMLLRLQQKEITAATAGAIEVISSYLSMLANYYQKEKQGELKFEY